MCVCAHKNFCLHLWYCAWRNWNSSLILSQESEVVNFSCCDEACQKQIKTHKREKQWEPHGDSKHRKTRWGETRGEPAGWEKIKNSNMKSSGCQFSNIQWVQNCEEIGCQECFHIQEAKCRRPWVDSRLKQHEQKQKHAYPFLLPDLYPCDAVFCYISQSRWNHRPAREPKRHTAIISHK